jgi:hypothetical protein
MRAGCYLLLSIASIRALWRQARTLSRRVLLHYTVVMLVLNTVFFVLMAIDTNLSFKHKAESPNSTSTIAQFDNCGIMTDLMRLIRVLAVLLNDLLFVSEQAHPMSSIWLELEPFPQLFRAFHIVGGTWKPLLLPGVLYIALLSKHVIPYTVLHIHAPRSSGNWQLPQLCSQHRTWLDHHFLHSNLCGTQSGPHSSYCPQATRRSQIDTLDDTFKKTSGRFILRHFQPHRRISCGMDLCGTHVSDILGHAKHISEDSGSRACNHLFKLRVPDHGSECLFYVSRGSRTYCVHSRSALRFWSSEWLWTCNVPRLRNSGHGPRSPIKIAAPPMQSSVRVGNLLQATTPQVTWQMIVFLCLLQLYRGTESSDTTHCAIN